MAKSVLNRTRSFLPSIFLCLLPLLLTTCSDDSVTTLPLAPQFADLGDPGTLGDRVWADVNNDGIQDSGEVGVEGIQVNLWLAGDLVQKAETDDAGAYSFTGLEAGLTYEIEFVKPEGYRFSPQNAGDDPTVDSDPDWVTGRVSVALAPGESDTSIDAGLFPLGSVTGLVWDDLDHDGIQEEGEPPLEGIEVHLLYTHIGSRQTFTDENGVYRFDNLQPSTDPHATVRYRLHFTLKDSDHLYSPEDQEDDDTVDSDADEDGFSHWFYVHPGQTMENIDAGMFYARPSVGDRVWNDLDMDGIQEDGEPGIEGITVYLYDLSGFPSPTRQEATTDALGNYLFDDLRWSDPEPHGGGPRYPYEIEFVLPEDTWFSPRGEGDDREADSDASHFDSRTGVFFLYAGEHRTDMDAGMFDARADLRGQVWNDVDMDGIQDLGEEGIENVLVVLDEFWPEGSSQHTTTDHSGNYSFRNLQWTEPGGTEYEYRLQFHVPEGHAISPRLQGDFRTRDSDPYPDGHTDYFTLAPGESRTDIDAGMYDGRATVRGRVWEDTDFDGYRDGGEPRPDHAVKVILHELWGEHRAHTTTASSGRYAFNDLQWTEEGGTQYEYQLEFVPVADPVYRFTTQHAGGDPARDSDADADGWSGYFTLAPMEAKEGIDAGVWLVRSGSIGDRVWEDLNMNGIQDGGEPGLADVTVHLFDERDIRIGTTVTIGPEGRYEFTGLETGLPGTGGPSYRPCFVLPSGFEYATPGQGGDEALDSDAELSDGCNRAWVLVYPYGQVGDVDAGMVNLNSATIGDWVWEDTNRNGIQDDGEPGVPGVVVELFPFPGPTSPIQTVTSGEDGRYNFERVRGGARGEPGTPPSEAYRVRFLPPPGYSFAPKDQGDEDRDSDANTLPVGVTDPFGVFAYDNITTLDAGLFASGSIRILKGTEPAGGTGFSFSAIGKDPAGNELNLGTTSLDDEGAWLLAHVPVGNYQVTEEDPGPEYRLAKLDCASGEFDKNLETRTVGFDLEAGETMECTFVNEATGTILIRKETVPGGRTGFHFSHDIGGGGTIRLDDGGVEEFLHVPAGTYTVTEVAMSSFHELGSVVCTETDGDDGSTGNLPSARSATIDLDPGETVDCTFTNEDQAPHFQAIPETQTVQYSDLTQTVIFTATDAAADHPTLVSVEWKEAGDTDFNSILPDFLVLDDRGCAINGDQIRCVWELTDVMGWPEGSYIVRLTVEDDMGEDHQVFAEATIEVAPEDASVRFDEDNPVAVPVAEAGGESGAFDLTVLVDETEPDEPAGSSAPGDIRNAQVSVQLVPVGPGGSASPTGPCTRNVSGIGYDQVLAVTCTFEGVPVNTYTVEVTVDGGFYEGYGEDVLTVYDPSLGFTTGGGWFPWPGEGERTNFGYTMKYNKKGQRVQGSLLLIRHVGGEAKYRVKSNALEGLALGDEGSFGWASFSGKSTYLEPGWPEPEGNHTFTVYVEDHGEPGAGADRFWIEVRDKDGVVLGVMSMDRPASDLGNNRTLAGGNIVVPHTDGR